MDAAAATGNGLRPDWVARGVRFLAELRSSGDGAVMGSPTSAAAAAQFLQRVGLTPDEITEALRLAESTPGALNGAPPPMFAQTAMPSAVSWLQPSAAAPTALSLASNSLSSSLLPSAATAVAAAAAVRGPSLFGTLRQAGVLLLVGAAVGYAWAATDAARHVSAWLGAGPEEEEEEQMQAGGMLGQADMGEVRAAASEYELPADELIVGEDAVRADEDTSGLPPWWAEATDAGAMEPGAPGSPWPAGGPVRYSHLGSMVSGLRDMDKDAASGVNELRALLRDINDNLHATVSHALDTSNASVSSLHTSVRALTGEVASLRHEVSVMSSAMSKASAPPSAARDTGSSPLERPEGSTSTRTLNFDSVGTDAAASAAASTPSGTAQVDTSAAAPAAGTVATRRLHTAPQIVEDFSTALKHLAAVNSSADVTAALPVLRMVLTHLLSNQPRYRRLPLSSESFKKTVFSLRDHRQVLAAMGFADDVTAWKWSPWSLGDGDTADMTASMDVVKQLLSVLTEVAGEQVTRPPAAPVIARGAATTEAESLPARARGESVSARSRSGSTSSVRSGLSASVGPRRPSADAAARETPQVATMPNGKVAELVLADRAHLLPGVQQVSDALAPDSESLLRTAAPIDGSALSPSAVTPSMPWTAHMSSAPFVLPLPETDSSAASKSDAAPAPADAADAKGHHDTALSAKPAAPLMPDSSLVAMIAVDAVDMPDGSSVPRTRTFREALMLSPELRGAAVLPSWLATVK